MPRTPHPADVYNAEIIARATAWTAFTQGGGRIVRHFETRTEARRAAQIMADSLRRPALVYAIDAMGRSAVADTIDPSKPRTSPESHMKPRTFSKRFNAQRAARAELGQEAMEGTHFRTIKTFGGWTWQRAKTAPATARQPADAIVETPATADPAADAATLAPKTADGKLMTIAPSLPGGADRLAPRTVEGSPMTTAPTLPSSTGVSRKGRGKRAALEDAARRGELPPPPDFSAPTHARYRAKLDRLVAMAEAGDVDGLKATVINPISSSPKAMARYRDLAVTALQARKE